MLRGCRCAKHANALILIAKNQKHAVLGISIAGWTTLTTYKLVLSQELR